ncbi:MAG: glucosaminidase domain-containing protein [Candidatus Nomurabacteria bacterium]|jgi:hypothetical protein|nr:glucosaminidase domain-containing protein [Candidatus Nomurabacteria bacterium]
MKKWLAGAVGLVFVMANLVPASAIATRDEELWNEAGILFYDPDDMAVECVSMTLGQATGSATAGLSAQQAAFVDQYQGLASALSVQYGIPWEAVMAQGILESAAGTSNFARNRNNFFGIGAYDTNPNNAHSFETPEAGWEGYYRFIRDNANYRNNGVFQEPTITNPYAYIAAIKAAGYATSPIYVSSLTPIIAAIITRANEQGWKTSAELARENPEMLNAAEQNAAGANAGSEVANFLTYCSGVSLTGDYATDLHNTILEFSWPGLRSHKATDPKPAYYNALEGFGFFGSRDAYIKAGASCDAFVATVMRASGADPEFPCCGTSNQMRYLKNSGKYTEIKNLRNVSNLQDGDIFILNGHIMIFVNEDSKPKVAHASRDTSTSCKKYTGMLTTQHGGRISSCARTGERGNVYFSDHRGPYQIFRRNG